MTQRSEVPNFIHRLFTKRQHAPVDPEATLSPAEKAAAHATRQVDAWVNTLENDPLTLVEASIFVNECIEVARPIDRLMEPEYTLLETMRNKAWNKKFCIAGGVPLIASGNSIEPAYEHGEYISISLVNESFRITDIGTETTTSHANREDGKLLFIAVRDRKQWSYVYVTVEGAGLVNNHLASKKLLKQEHLAAISALH